MTTLLLVSLVLVTGCAEIASTPTKADSAGRVEPVAGTTLNRVVLSERAVEQLGIITAPVTVRAGTGGGPDRRAVLYGAVLYEATGATLVYTNPQPLVFVGQPVVVESIQGDTATLIEGPPVGTPVVSVGAAELFGIEFGVGK